jgi:sugar phosphate isomerase/epimerase
MEFTRRDLGRIALASVPLGRAFGAKMIDSKIDGVQIGAISYSFNRIASPDPEAIVKAYVAIGLGECELMSNHCEALAGAPAMPSGRGGGGGRAASQARGGGAAADGGAAAPPAGAGTGQPGAQRGGGGGGRTPLTPEQQAEREAAMAKVAQWRAAATADTWKAVRKKFNDVGVELALLCYNMQDSMKDEDIEYGFSMAKGLGVKAISTSTTLTMAKRIAPLADKHKMMVGYHGHDQTNDPNQTATLESYATLMGYGKYNGINLDIGHFTAANYDAVAFIKEHHAKITNLHIKDRKKDHGPNVAVWGTGDTPIKPVMQLLKEMRYPFPANLELEYQGLTAENIVDETKKCFAYVKSCLV